jgi:hypothetical protein
VSFSLYIREKLESIEGKVKEGFEKIRDSHSALEQRQNVSDGRITALETRVSIHEGQVGHTVGVSQLRDAEKRIDILESQTQSVNGALTNQQNAIDAATKAAQNQRETRRWLIGIACTIAVTCVAIVGLLITVVTALSGHVSLH